MLEIRPAFEHCGKNLQANAVDAMICSYECTFCKECVEQVLKNVCPNCGGGFVRRPIRPQQEWIKGVSLNLQPGAIHRLVKPVDSEAQRILIGKVCGLADTER